MSKFDTITVTLDEPVHDEDIEHWLNAIRMLDNVADVEAGSVDDMEYQTARTRIRGEVYEALDEVFD